MFDNLTMGDMKSRIDEHLLMVEEVLGGMDSFIQQLESRISRIEKALGVESDGESSSGVLADMQRVKTDLESLRDGFKRS